MSWLTFTIAHVESALSAQELTALRSTRLAQGQTDPLPEIIERTAGEVRGYVGAKFGALVGQPGTLPEELLAAAVALARWRLLGRLPVKLLQTEGREKEYEDAIQQLRDAAAGKFAFSAPEAPSDDQPRESAEGNWGGAKDF